MARLLALTTLFLLALVTIVSATSRFSSTVRPLPKQRKFGYNLYLSNNGIPLNLLCNSASDLSPFEVRTFFTTAKYDTNQTSLSVARLHKKIVRSAAGRFS